MIFSDASYSYIMTITFYILCCPNETTMDTRYDADTMNELSRRTMTNAILYTDIYINIVISRPIY